VATGIKAIRPDLEVWVATGDGDALSIGGNHTIHMLRRNVGIKVLLFQQFAFTGSRKANIRRPRNSTRRRNRRHLAPVDRPFNPVSLAIGAEATFVARYRGCFPIAPERHAQNTPPRTRVPRLLEILQNCNIFNDGAWFSITERDARSEHVIQLEHGKPLVFGKNRDKGIRRKSDGDIEVVPLGNGIPNRTSSFTTRIIHARRTPSCSRTWSIDPAFPHPSASFAHGTTCPATKTS